MWVNGLLVGALIVCMVFLIRRARVNRARFPLWSVWMPACASAAVGVVVFVSGEPGPSIPSFAAAALGAAGAMWLTLRVRHERR